VDIGVPALPANEGYSVTLQWREGFGPTINLYSAYEQDGGTLYLSDTATAISTVLNSGVAYGTVAPSAVFTLLLVHLGIGTEAIHL